MDRPGHNGGRWVGGLVPAIVATAILAACGTASPQATLSPEIDIGSDQIFDGLDIQLVFDSDEPSDENEVVLTLLLGNHTGDEVADPACHLGSGRHALVTTDVADQRPEPVDPATFQTADADLWLQATVDCEGPSVIAEGHVGPWDTYRFLTTDKAGRPLPPGDYVAVLEVEGLSRSLRHPVTVMPDGSATASHSETPPGASLPDVEGWPVDLVEPVCRDNDECVFGFLVGEIHYAVGCERVRGDVITDRVLAEGAFAYQHVSVRLIENVDPLVMVAVELEDDCRGDGELGVDWIGAFAGDAHNRAPSELREAICTVLDLDDQQRAANNCPPPTNG